MSRLAIEHKCFLTGHPAKVDHAPRGRDAFIITCPACGMYEVSGTLAASSGVWAKYANRLHLLAAVARQHSDAGKRLDLHTGNIEGLLASVDAPETPLERIDQIGIHSDINQCDYILVPQMKIEKFEKYCQQWLLSSK